MHLCNLCNNFTVPSHSLLPLLSARPPIVCALTCSMRPSALTGGFNWNGVQQLSRGPSLSIEGLAALEHTLKRLVLTLEPTLAAVIARATRKASMFQGCFYVDLGLTSSV